MAAFVSFLTALEFSAPRIPFQKQSKKLVVHVQAVVTQLFLLPGGIY